MADDDQSLATLTEDWIVTQIRTLEDFQDRDVEAFDGTLNLQGRELVEELARHGSPYVTVMFEGDVPRELEEGAQRYEPTYVIFAVIKNDRPKAARRGDGTSIGTNKVRDLLRTALHDKRPALTAGGHHTDITEFRGSRVVFQRSDLFIQRSTLVVIESPTGA